MDNALSTLHRPKRQISIVIPAYNAAATLPACLEALQKSTVKPLETLVVCDGCSDETAVIAKRWGARVIEYEGQKGAGYARNVGAAAAHGNAFFFIDADCAARPDALALAAEAIQSGEHLAFGSYTIATRVPGFLTTFKNLQHYYTHQHGLDYQTTFWSGCGIVSRESFEETAGFDIALRSCEDIEFGAAASRLGYRVRLIRAMQVEHLKRYDLAGLVKSDLFQRAVPWTQLIHSGRAGMGVLNTDIRGQASVASAGLFLAGLFLSPVWLPGAALSLLTLLLLLFANKGLLALVKQELGVFFSLAAIGPLLLHYTICGVGYGLGRLKPKLPDSRTHAPQYNWVENEPLPAYAVAHAKTSP